MSSSPAAAYAPTQAAEFSGPGKHALVLYTPEWTDLVLAVLQARPDAYEAVWRYQPDRRAHVLEVEYEGGLGVGVALIDGIHNAVIAQLARGCALVLSPYPIYREYENLAVERLFDPEHAIALPTLPNPLG